MKLDAISAPRCIIDVKRERIPFFEGDPRSVLSLEAARELLGDDGGSTGKVLYTEARLEVSA